MKLKKVLNFSIMALLLSVSVFLTACAPKKPQGSGAGGNEGGVTPGPGGVVIEKPKETPNTTTPLHELFSKFKVITNSKDVTVKDPANNNQTSDFEFLINRQLDVLTSDLIYRLVATYGAGAATNSEGVFPNNTAFNLSYGENGNKNDYKYSLGLATINAKIDNLNLIYDYDNVVNKSVTYLNRDGTPVSLTRSSPYINELASYADALYSGTWNTDSGSTRNISKFFSNINAIQGGYSWDENLMDTSKVYKFKEKFTNLDSSWKISYMQENYFEILGLQWGASEYEVLERYKELYAEYQPKLKYSGLPGYEKAEMEFIAIERAMEILTDMNKRQNFLNEGNSIENTQNLTVLPSTSAKDAYDSYVNNHFATIRNKLANMLAGKTGKDATLTDDEAVNVINRIGFSENDRNNLINLIKNEIIGEQLINIDNALLNGLKDILVNDSGQTDYILDDEGISALVDDAIYKISVGEIPLAYYKAYDLLVPAIVDSMLSNAFGGKQVDRLERMPGDPNGTPKLTNGKISFKNVWDLENKESSFSNVDGTIKTDELYLVYANMTRSGSTDLDINETPPVEEGEVPEIEQTPYLNIDKIILQPKKDVALLELVMLMQAEENVEMSFRIRTQYKANGVIYLDEYVSSSTNPNKSDKTLFTIEGKYDNGQYSAGQGVPWTYDLNIYDHMYLKHGSTIKDNFPLLRSYDGVDTNNYDIWNNNPYKLRGYDAGNNYVQVSFEYVSANRVVGSQRVAINDLSNLKMSVGFLDPMF